MDIYIDPTTNDYVLQQGAPVRDPLAGLGNAVYVRLMTPLGSYWEDPTLGSRLHELERGKDLSRNQVLAKQYSEMALKPIVDDGRATRIDVSVESIKDATGSGSGRLQLNIEVYAATGERQTFKFPLKVM